MKTQYIVIPIPTYPTNHFSTINYTGVTPVFFNTKEELLKYLQSNPGKCRIFEGKELEYNVEVCLRDKEDKPLFRSV